MKMSVETAFETLQKDQTLLNDYPNIKDEKFKQLIDELWPDEHRNILLAVHLHDFIKMIAINPKVMCQLLDKGEAYNELYNQHN